MSLLDLLKRAAQLKSGLDNLRPIDREQEARIMQKFRLDWNYHSNHLEGNSLTYGETKALILFGITAQGKPLKDHIEMTGHDEAVKWIEDVVKEERPLTENFIRELNLLVLKEPSHGKAQTPSGQPTTKLKVPGQYKTQPNHVQTVTGEMFYFASPEETPAKMHDLVEWFRGKKNEADTNPVLLAAEFHYKIIRIHPFDDGNGRTARILMNFILMQYGYPPVVIKTNDKQNYIAALRQADAGLLEPFMEYIADNLIHSLELMVKGAKGENIDEPDDLDKEIALLEQRLKGINGIELIRTDKLAASVFENSIIKLIIEFAETSKKISKLYHDFEVDISLRPISGNGWTHFSSEGISEKYFMQNIQQIRHEIATPIDNNFINTITLNSNYDRNKSFEGFSYTSQIAIMFDYTTYRIVTNSATGLVIKKYYSEQLTDDEIDLLVKSETKRHTQAIEAKIKEMQNRK